MFRRNPAALRPRFNFGEQRGDTAQRRNAYQRKYRAGNQALRAAAQPCHGVKVKQPDKPPVDAADDNQHNANLIKRTQKTTPFLLQKVWRGFAFYIHGKIRFSVRNNKNCCAKKRNQL